MSRLVVSAVLAACSAAVFARAQGADTCANAPSIVGEGVFAFDTTSATTDGAANVPCVPGGQLENDVWWSWFAPATGAYDLSVCGASFDTVLAVYDGSCTGPLEVCDDDGCGSASKLVVDAFGGHTYALRLGSKSAAARGSGQLTIALRPLPAVQRTLVDPASGHVYRQLAGSSWRDARRKAVELGAELARIDDAAEQAWITANFHVFQAAPIDLWIGLDDSASEGVFTWSNGQSPAFTFWSAGEPDDGAGSGEDFVALRADDALARWIDLPDEPLAPHASPHGLVEDATIHVQAFCFGDGLDTTHTSACPCGNIGAPGRGCASSFVAAGASLTAQGATNPDTLVLSVAGTPATATGVYLQHAAPGDAVLFDGVTCTSGTALRLCTRASSGGASAFPLPSDLASLSQSGGVIPGSGTRRFYSVAYRNAAPFCTPATANVTNALVVDW